MPNFCIMTVVLMITLNHFLKNSIRTVKNLGGIYSSRMLTAHF